MTILTKCASPILEIKEMGEKGAFSGYASTFGGEPDSYGDIIAKGAYKDSLQEHSSRKTMPKMFWQHSPNEPIGQWVTAKEDEKGLFVEGRLNMGVQRGREAYELLKAGDIDGLSIGYRVKEYSVDEENDIWTLEKIDLHEISVVSIGANTAATIDDVKSNRVAIQITKKLSVGERLTEREFETLLKGSLGLSNSQAERAARVHLKGQGELAKKADETLEFLQALSG